MRAFIRWICLIFLFIHWVPVSAQQGSIAGIIANRPDLSTLAVFLEAVPDYQEQLSQAGNYTFFAPNNTAFENLASLLEVPLQDILSNPSIVTSIMQYHTLDGALSSADIRGRNGQLVPTRLYLAYIGVRTQENTISLNNVVEIVEADIAATNGTLHIINDVMLNRIITDALDNANASAVISPARATSTASVAQTPIATPATTLNGQIRVLHLSVDTPPIDVFFYDAQAQSQRRIISNLAYGSTSEPVTIPTGSTRIYLTLADTSTSASFIITNQSILPDTPLVLALIGNRQLADRSALSFPAPTLPSDVLMIHAVNGADTITATLDDTEIGTLAYGEGQVISLPDGGGVLSFLPDGQEAITFDLENGGIIALSGEANAIETLAIGSQAVAASATESAPEMTILEWVNSQEDFSILASVLEATSPSVQERLQLQHDEPMTFLAPTNQAFRNLFATIGLSERRFVNDYELLNQIMLYHMVEGRYTSADFSSAAGTSIVTALLPYEAFFVRVSSDRVLINGFVRFVETDIPASNGIIHTVNNVLLPQAALDEFGL